MKQQLYINAVVFLEKVRQSDSAHAYAYKRMHVVSGASCLVCRAHGTRKEDTPFDAVYTCIYMCFYICIPLFKSLHAYTYIYAHLISSTSAFELIYMYTHTHIYIYISYMNACIHTYIPVRASHLLHVCICAYMYVYIYIYIHIHIIHECMHTYIHNCTRIPCPSRFQLCWYIHKIYFHAYIRT
jgi:hypothetical protein